MPSEAIERIESQLAVVTAATTRLLATVDTLDDAAIPQPSLLPNWTRGHVLAHLSRSADALVNLLLWAHTGVETPQYANDALRDADIELGAPRPLAEQRADLVQSADRLLGLAKALPAEKWNAEVRTRQGRTIPASQVPWLRLREVEIHHVDLDAGYTPADWPADFVNTLLPEITASLSPAAETPFAIRAADTGFEAVVGSGAPDRTITAPACRLLAWLIGRGASEDLPRPLPALPAWL
ncbi:maleylpyruvate isomerase family mycothiol-dependent enzyme [Nocardia paucivorans]|uniref:maleylpyruvate isomerase family mycothiol-dependent enzyme n=1 Tax=Nocardia paucivorans TaxID=114259 RepID=UPI0002E093A8|nr:maleylpyruvate isomerase family mycothiol-dependent enzyme [Nocardia paucivorans]